MEKVESGKEIIEGEFEEYDVKTPQIPESAEKETEKEKKIGRGLINLNRR